MASPTVPAGKVAKPSTDDAALLAAFALPATRQRAFATIVGTYQPRIHRQMLRMTLSHADADDLAQETFIKAWTALDKFEGRSSLFTWLYRIATNLALAHLEGTKKRAYTPLDASNEGDGGDSATPLSERVAAPTQLDGTAVQAALAAALEALPPKQRLVFTMRYYDEMPYEEMSTITGTSVGALKASYHHAATKVHEALIALDAHTYMR